MRMRRQEDDECVLQDICVNAFSNMHCCFMITIAMVTSLAPFPHVTSAT